VLATAAVATGCARAQANIVVAPPPPLEVPPPPPRVVEPIGPVLAEIVPEAGEPLIGTAEPRPSPPPPPRTGPRDARPDAAPAAGAPPAEPQRPAQAATLQTVPPGQEGPMQRSIRVHLDSAAANLNRVEYRTLSTDGRATFNQARRFMAQAEDALQNKNLVFAATVADKAATLAAQLAGR
jgi:hypothetical protein